MSTISKPPQDSDALFLERELGPGQFKFDEQVAQVFPDMLRRSIPGYRELLHLIGILATDYAQPESTIYDLGASLGAVSLAIRHAIGDRKAEVIAVDNSKAMVSRMRQIFSDDNGLCQVSVQEADLQTLELKPASLIVLNFTLQFIPLAQREELLLRLSKALLPGGMLIISEKIADEQGFYQSLHDSFRAKNGYSKLEMSRKRSALEEVLIPTSTEQMETWLKAAKLDVYPIFRALQFVSWAAIKPSSAGKKLER